MFKKLKQMFGVGGPEVDAVLQSSAVRPGEVLRGEIRITGGDDDREFTALTMAFRANVEADRPGTQDAGAPGGRHDHDPNRPGHQTDADQTFRTRFGAVQLQGPGVIRAGQQTAVPFELPVPWDIPFNVFRGQLLQRLDLGLETRFDLPGGRDATDFDPLQVHSLPVHETVAGALERLGYRLAHADLERGAAPGSTLEVHNELEFVRTKEIAGFTVTTSVTGGVQEAELTFVTGPEQTTVVLSLQRKAILAGNRDRFATFAGPTHQPYDWDGAMAHHVQQLLDAGGVFFG